MKRILSSILAVGCITSASIAHADNYNRYSYQDVYSVPAHSGVNDYIYMGFGSFNTDLEEKAALISFAFQRNLPSGIGYGVNLSHSLTSSVTEADSGDLDMRYIALSPYINTEFNLLRIDEQTTLRGYLKLGASAVKTEGNYSEAVFNDYEYGAYYGAGLTMPFSQYADWHLGVNVQDAVDTLEVQGGLRFLF